MRLAMGTSFHFVWSMRLIANRHKLQISLKTHVLGFMSLHHLYKCQGMFTAPVPSWLSMLLAYVHNNRSCLNNEQSSFHCPPEKQARFA